jgi:hypothetical protein
MQAEETHMLSWGRLHHLLVRPWTDLRGISNSNAAKSTILIPLIGYWIIFNESVLSWLQLAHPLGGHATSYYEASRGYLDKQRKSSGE